MRIQKVLFLTFFVFFSWWGEVGSKYHYKRVIIDPPAKRHLNGVSLACRRWPNIKLWLGSFGIFQGIRTSIARKPNNFVIFQRGGVRTPFPPPLWIRICAHRISLPTWRVSAKGVRGGGLLLRKMEYTCIRPGCASVRILPRNFLWKPCRKHHIIQLWNFDINAVSWKIISYCVVYSKVVKLDFVKNEVMCFYWNMELAYFWLICVIAIFYFYSYYKIKTCVVGTQKNRLNERRYFWAPKLHI